jgi:hypothetical protein
MQVVWAAHRMVVVAYSEHVVLLKSYVVPVLVVQYAMTLVPTQVDRQAPVQRTVARSNWSLSVNTYFLTMTPEHGEPDFP